MAASVIRERFCSCFGRCVVGDWLNWFREGFCSVSSDPIFKICASITHGKLVAGID